MKAVKPMHFDNTFIASAKFRYGFLAILLALLACDLWELPGQLHSGSAIPYRAVFLSLGLIFNHLAFFCLPHRAASRVARVFAVAWLTFVLVYGFTPLLR
jgi:hypothetical protein